MKINKIMNILSINFRKVPFSRIVLFLILGIILGSGFNVYSGIMMFLLCAFFVLVWIVFLLGRRYLRVTRFYFGVTSLFALCAGFVLYESHNDVEHIEKIHGEIELGKTFFGVVADKETKGNKVKYILEINSFKTDSVEVSNCSFRILLIKSPKTLYKGDIIQLDGSVKMLHEPNHSLDFNYKKFLARKHIYYQMFKPFAIEILRTSEPKVLQVWQNKYVLGIKHSLLKQDTKNVLKAMLAGDKSTLGEITNIFRKTGTSHVLAISGLHVGIISMLIHFLCGFLEKRIEWIRPLAIVVGGWSFCLLSGAYPSTVRACTMVSLYCVGLLLKRKSFGLNLCCIAAFFMLIYNPNLLFDIGFQFSFLAVLGILLFYQPIYRVVLLRGLADKLWQMTVLSLSAQVFILPLSIYYFHTFPVYFIVASWIAVPMTFLIVIVGLILVLCELMGFKLSLLAHLLDVILDLLLYILEFFANIPHSTIDNLWPSTSEMVLYYVFFGFMIYYIQSISRRSMVLALTSFCLLLLTSYWNQDLKKRDKIIIYKCQNYRVMDYVSHGNVIRFFDDNIEDKKLNYLTKSSTSFYQVDSISFVPLNTNDNHFIQIQSYKILFYNKKLESDSFGQVDIYLTNKLTLNHLKDNASLFSVDQSGLRNSFSTFEHTIYLNK